MGRVNRLYNVKCALAIFEELCELNQGDNEAMHVKGAVVSETSHLIRLLRDLFKSQKLAVLATQKDGQPYTSLVAFVATGDLKYLLFATNRGTRKYANIAGDSRLAMLVDNRSNQETDFHNAVAVTATGKAEELKNSERESYVKIYLAKHPKLQEFVMSPTCALLRVVVESYYLVSRFQNVIELCP